MKTSFAKIHWIPTQLGGRRRPPQGPRYLAQVRFEGFETSEVGDWSLEVRFEGEASFCEPTVAQVGLLSQKGPLHLLRVGRRFDLFEGACAVAHGVVVRKASDKSIAQDQSQIKGAAQRS